MCQSVDPRTGKECSLKAGHTTTGPIVIHMDEGTPFADEVSGKPGMRYVVWRDEEEEKEDD